jgi:hypothetical protein
MIHVKEGNVLTFQVCLIERVKVKRHVLGEALVECNRNLTTLAMPRVTCVSCDNNFDVGVHVANFVISRHLRPSVAGSASTLSRNCV